MGEKKDTGPGAVIFSIEGGTVIDPKEVEGAVEKDEGIKGEARKFTGTLAADCPVIALGHNSGVFYYLSAARQLRRLTDSAHKRLELGAMFGNREAWLRDHFPRYDKESQIVGWRPEQLAHALWAACYQKGIWDPSERQRGAGAWAGDNGELILHCGDSIWVGPDPKEAITITEIERGGKWLAPGEMDGYVYPASAPSPRFAAEPVPGGADGPAQELLDLLMHWPYRRGHLDAQLLLGWICCAMIGGALPWRPALWLTGGMGSGKSVLKDVIKAVLGNDVIFSSNATGPGVWQKLGHRTIPVVIEEMEAEIDNRRAAAVMSFAQQASSGGLILRGGSDHSGTEFTARSCFIFSAINPPPMSPAQMSRSVIIELDEITAETQPDFDIDQLKLLGLRLRRRLVDNWPRFADTFGKYRSTLRAIKHTARSADQFASLVAGFDMVTADGAPDDETANAWAAKLAPGSLVEIADAGQDEELCRDHLLTVKVDALGVRHPLMLGEWIARAAGWSPDTGGFSREDSNKVLATYGLKIVEHEAAFWLLIANNHAGLAQLYQGTHWAGRSGALGGWARPWRRLAQRHGGGVSPKPHWIGGTNLRVSMIPLRAVLSQGPAYSALGLTGEAGEAL